MDLAQSNSIADRVILMNNEADSYSQVSTGGDKMELTRETSNVGGLYTLKCVQMQTISF